MSQKSKQFVALTLVVIFALYYANICFFYHSHIINGSTIIHSHIHSETGTHSESELTLISALSVFQSLQAALCFAGPGIFLLLQAFILPFFEKSIRLNPVACISMRAPPSFL
jgi:hypothetical protein